MSEKVIIKNCSPTLAGLKTGNLFRVRFRDRSEMLENIRRWNGILCKKGLRVIPFENKSGSTLVYVYRISRLSRDLRNVEAKRILTQRGYFPDAPEKCVARLSRRLKYSPEFPHEIGLFLGYPPEDVRGFIEKRECKCAGCWKVYSDEEFAEKQFVKFKKCTEVYCRLYSAGRSIERLTVSG